MVKILPVVMCGGSGTRVWPESRASLPKQFISLVGERSTFQNIIGVVSDGAVFLEPIVLTNSEYRFRVAEQLEEIGAKGSLVLEPIARDSGPAVAVVIAARTDPRTIVAVLASDHVFGDATLFARLCGEAGRAAAEGLHHRRRRYRPSELPLYSSRRRARRERQRAQGPALR
jgi:mannose-1-phosphate guanylyltransferase / mannose-6-phosphate isomerase